MFNVNGQTRVINLSVAAGQLRSVSQQSCQNSAAARTEIAAVVCGDTEARLQAENWNWPLKCSFT